MKVKDLVEECKNRPTKKDCEVCPFTEKMQFFKRYSIRNESI